MQHFLNLSGLVPHEVTETDEQITAYVPRDRASAACCVHCGVVGVAPNGSRTVSYQDLPIRGKPVTIEWDRQRFLCRDCGKASRSESPHLHADFQITTRLYDWIGKRSLGATFAAVATDVGLDERSVRRVFEHWSDTRLAGLRFETPRWLGVDEVHLLHAARGVMTDIEERTLVDLLPNRNQDTMARRIAQMPDRDRVEAVAMDMWVPYRRIAANLLPQAVVVVDKWHVTKYADKGMESIRKGFREHLDSKQRRRLIKDRFLLLSRRRNLSPMQVVVMGTWLEHFPELAAAYAAKEAFYDIYDSPDRVSAEAAYDAWDKSLTPEMRVAFKELLSATRNWHREVFNYFDRPITNAYTEAINGLIKIANRAGRGYSFNVLRARMLLGRASTKYKGLPPGIMPRSKFGPVGLDIPTLTDELSRGHLGFAPTGSAG